MGDLIMDTLSSLAGNRRYHGNRHNIFKEATLQFGDHSLDVLVSVRNISAGGAKLWLSPAHSLPAEFDVYFADDALIFRASLRWRSGEYAGVAFVGEPRHIAP